MLLFPVQLAPCRLLVCAFGSCPSRLHAFQARFFFALSHSDPWVSELRALIFRIVLRVASVCLPSFARRLWVSRVLALHDCNFSLDRVHASGLLQQRLRLPTEAQNKEPLLDTHGKVVLGWVGFSIRAARRPRPMGDDAQRPNYEP